MSVMLWNGKVIGVEPPPTVVLEIKDTDPGIKGEARCLLPLVVESVQTRTRRLTSFGILLPPSLTLCPSVPGNTASGGSKPATLETGAIVSVPLFVNIGDKITVDTRAETYLGRAN